MDPKLTKLESLLETLGQARRDGVFSASASQYPWQVAAAQKADRRTAQFGWLRVAVPLAAAAAVAVLFVAPSLQKSRSVAPIAGSLNINPSSETAQHMADAEKSLPSAATFDCDYNGDGVIDGRDIQAFMDHLKDIHGDPSQKADYLQKCLLGS